MDNDNNILAKNAEEVIQALKNRTYFIIAPWLNSLSLAHANIYYTNTESGLEDEELRFFSENVLKNNTTLTELDISGNNIGSAGVMHLLHALIHNSTLTRLYLQNNPLGADGIKHILLFKYYNTTTTLYFDGDLNNAQQYQDTVSKCAVSPIRKLINKIRKRICQFFDERSKINEIVEDLCKCGVYDALPLLAKAFSLTCGFYHTHNSELNILREKMDCTESKLKDWELVIPNEEMDLKVTKEKVEEIYKKIDMIYQYQGDNFYYNKNPPRECLIEIMRYAKAFVRYMRRCTDQVGQMMHNYRHARNKLTKVLKRMDQMEVELEMQGELRATGPRVLKLLSIEKFSDVSLTRHCFRIYVHDMDPFKASQFMLFAALSVTIPMDIKKITIEHDENKTIDDLPESNPLEKLVKIAEYGDLVNARMNEVLDSTWTFTNLLQVRLLDGIDLKNN